MESKPTILYIDDEENNLSVFVATFRRYYKIITANSASTALELLKHNKVDLILTDQRMPEVTGVEFLESITPLYPMPTRMILTGFSDIEAIIDAVNKGHVLRYITKPWDEDELKQALDLGVKIHSLEEQNQELLKSIKEKTASLRKSINLFKRYIPDDLVQKILDSNFDQKIFNNQNSKLISVLFSDIRHFTNFSEHRQPKEVLDYLNMYFTRMVDCVVKNHGTVYKFMADGFIVIFGSDESGTDYNMNSVYCALDMIDALEEFNKSISSKIDYDEAIVGIGISTGTAIIGHIVADNFLSHTVIGEVVDQAIKIESYTKKMPNAILISESTYNSIRNNLNEIICSKIDNIEESILNHNPLFRITRKKALPY